MVTGLTLLTWMATGATWSMASMKSCYRLGSLACRIPRAAPELSFGGSAAAHGLLAVRAGWGVGIALLLAGFESPGDKAFAETAAFLEGLTLRGDLAFQHIQGPADDEQHGVRRDHGILRMQLPESAMFVKKLGHGGVGVG